MRIMVSCGEPSGDLYAGALTAALRERVPGADVFGLGGDRVEAAGGRLIGHYRGLSATGLLEPLRVVPRALGVLRRLLAAADATPPDVFVAVDFPDFNFRLLSPLARRGVPIVYYISPQLWAWRGGRMRTMQRLVDQVLVIFPFEEPIYRDAGLPVQFVGHPLVEMAEAAVAGQSREDVRVSAGLSPDAPTVALLPGSRRNELERLVPVLADALAPLASRIEHVQFLVAAAPHLPDELFEPLRQAAAPLRRPLALVRDATDSVLLASDVAVTASGTATVQCAIHGCPMVVVYRLSPLTYRLGKGLVKVDTYAMPNLIAGRRVVPELIQDACTPARIVEATVALLTDAPRRAQVREALRGVRDRLHVAGASGRAADAVIEVARTGVRRKPD